MTVLELFDELRRRRSFPAYRDKDIKTAITRYLAPAFGVPVEELADLATIRATYKHHLHVYVGTLSYLSVNTINMIKNQLSCLFRAADAAGLIPPAKPDLQRPWPSQSVHAILAEARQHSPYRQRYQHRYRQPKVRETYRWRLEAWPQDIAAHWRQYRADRALVCREITLHGLEEHLQAYVGYACGQDQPPAQGWDDLFDIGRVKRFVAWHAKRVGAEKISAYAHHTLGLLARLAKHEGRPEATALYALEHAYHRPPRMHNKNHPDHTFTRAELEQLACAMMRDGRRPLPRARPHRKYHGLRRAIVWQTGFILRLMLRLGVRQRTMRELQMPRNLYRVNGGWVIHLDGEQLKVSTRKGRPNSYHVDFPEDLVAELDEFLTQVRPRFPQADTQPYVFLTAKGRPLSQDALYGQIMTQVYLRSGKRLYPHLLRTLLFVEGVQAGKDINFLAAVLNIDPVTALRHYNELREAQALKSLAEFNRLTLTLSGEAIGSVQTTSRFPFR